MTRSPPALARLTEAVSVLADESVVLELAVRALYDVCPRGVAIGFTSVGADSARAGAARIVHEGALVEVTLPHLAYVRTPAYDVTDVPLAQRNRWVEPFREGIATHDGWRKSTLYPFVRHFGVLEQGRVAVCSGARQVAFAGAAIPEGTEFSARERTKLTETARALVVPLRVAAMIGEVQRARSALDELLEGTSDVIFALDARGAVVGTSRPAFELLRRDRALPDQLREATRGRTRVGTVVSAGRTLHVSPCGEPGVRWLVAADGPAVEPRPVLTARQRELVALLEKGLTNAEIARALGVAAPTVKTTLERLYRRVGVGNRVELLARLREP